MTTFAEEMKLLQAKMPRKVSSRGWCYILEGLNVINKGQFDLLQDKINECRKEGLLPLDFVEADDSRQFYNREDIHVETETPRDYLKRKIEYLRDVDEDKEDVAFWENQEYFIEMAVEKIDLRNLFHDTCKKYHIGIGNAKGWEDIISRGILASRFKEAEERGLKPVMLYFGDFDIGGLLIANTFKKNMKDLEKATGWDPKHLIFDHVGLSYDFILKNNLTWIDNLTSGSGKAPDKSKAHVREYIANYGERKCEANAVLVIEPIVIDLLEKTIQKYLGNPFEKFDQAKKKTQGEVKELMDSLGVKIILNSWLESLQKPLMQEKDDHDSNIPDHDVSFVLDTSDENGDDE